MARIRGGTREHPAALLAGAAILTSGILLLHWLGRLTFWRDEWDFLLHRRSWSVGTFLDPFVEHLVAVSILIYKVGISAFGMDSARPFQLVSVALFLLSVALLFVYVARRLGEWLALAAILPILFLGPSWDDLLFPFQMALFGSVACGISALIAIERRDRTWDLVAMGLLILSLLFSDLGIPFVAGVTVQLAFDRDHWRRAFVVVVPTALWLLWYAGWGHNAETFISAANFAHSPSYIFRGLGTSLAVWGGLSSTPYDANALEWGRPLLILLLGLAAWRLYVLRRPSPRVLGTAVILLGFWFLTALNTNPFAPATAGRYQYIGIVLLALLAAELAAGLRVRRYATVALVLFATAAAMVNLVRLRDAAHGLAGIAEKERGGLAALELTRGRVNPQFILTKENSDVDYLEILDAGSYFSAVDADGSPAYTPAELASASEDARIAADKVFASALGVGLRPGLEGRRGRCVELRPSSQSAVVQLPPEGIVLRATTSGSHVSLRRYASSFPVSPGTLQPGQSELLSIPPDRSPRPWILRLDGGGPVLACRAQLR
jgi:hypothetical protein